MKLTKVMAEINASTFNCSWGAQLLADQPTADEVSHAHVHTLDPFKVDTTKIKPASFKAPATVDTGSLVNQRKLFWENPELHLTPRASQSSHVKLHDASTAKDTFKPYEFYLDETRLALNDTYLKRGMAEIPEKKGYVRTMVYKADGATKPSSLTATMPNKIDLPALPPKATLVKAVDPKEVILHPTFQAMEAHSMFEDSEVLVMATTAVLLSDAGKLALTRLVKEAATFRVGLYSYSAVKAVEDTFKAKGKDPLKQVERSPTTVGVDKSKQVETTGATYTKVDMKRVILIMYKDMADDLIIVTCYPSQKQPTVPLGVPQPTVTDDLAELDRAANEYQVVKQASEIKLTW